MRTKLNMVSSGSSSRNARRCFLVLGVFIVAFATLLYENPRGSRSVSVSSQRARVDSTFDACDDSLDSCSRFLCFRFLKTSSVNWTLFGDASAASGVGGSQSGSSAPERKSFWEKQRRSFEKTFIVEGRWRLFANGLAVTLGITIASTLLGTLFAFLQCCMRRSTRKWLRYPAKVYIGLMQGTPILVILLIMYYVVFAKLQAPWGLEKEIVATISLALNFAAYAGEMMRTGVDSIDKGLVEAARALGFGRFQVFSKVIFPIATRRIIPVYKGEFISLLKTTSIVGYIATQDLTKASDIVRARTYEAFFPLVATAIIYLLSAHLLASVFAFMEYRLNPVNRRKRAKGEVNV